MASRRPRIIGHRGARGLWPENTTDGFRRTFAAGVNTVELDVGVTADDVAVVTHDAHLNPDITRDASGCWIGADPPLVRSLSLAELQAYDVGRIRPGTRYAELFADQAPQDEARIPSLAEVLAIDPAATFLVELKTFPDAPELTVSPDRMADLTVAAAEAAGAVGRITVLSFDWRGLRHLQRTRPDVPLGWLTEPADDATHALWWDAPEAGLPSAPAAIAGSGGRLWLPFLDQLTEDLVSEAQGLGLEVITWGIGDRAGADRAAALGVDGIITDRPDLA